MTITGYLRSFSLAELLRVLTQNNKTGLLTVYNSIQTPGKPSSYYLWLQSGRIMAAGHLAYQYELLDLLKGQTALPPEALHQIEAGEVVSMPLGEWLREHHWVSASRLRELFYGQVMRTMCGLLRLQDGWFQFDSKAQPPWMNMTGFSTSPTTVVQSGLRNLQNWSVIAHLLPAPESKLMGLSRPGKRPRFVPLEWQVWEFATGTMPLTEIAQHLQISVEMVRQVACSLIMAGFAEEIPTDPAESHWPDSEGDAWLLSEQGIDQQPKDWPFLGNLFDFLKEL